ncbi:MAG: type II toxin-antitoxin system VapC family toxin [Methanomicrobiales archaeon]|nr:type II toxin-antitoxin system VapC family toxin [Methanomicrobiales archaeon]
MIDSNILIHILAGDLPERAYSIVREICNQSFLVSIISKIEIPGWKNGTPDGLAMARNLLLEADIISLSDPISDIAITIRQKQAIKLPDAVIAGTAIFLDATLVT